MTHARCNEVESEGASLSTYPHPIRVALATFEAFRRLGFVADDIYFAARMRSAGNPEEHGIGILLRVRGREFGVYSGDLDLPRDQAIVMWKAAAHRWATCSEAERQSVWQESGLAAMGVPMIVGLAQKGIFIPKGTN